MESNKWWVDGYSSSSATVLQNQNADGDFILFSPGILNRCNAGPGIIRNLSVYNGTGRRIDPSAHS